MTEVVAEVGEPRFGGRRIAEQALLCSSVFAAAYLQRIKVRQWLTLSMLRQVDILQLESTIHLPKCLDFHHK